MAEAIQFPCPACGITLRLPFEMAAIRGPCPSCHQEIIAPDPANGTSAMLPPPATEMPREDLPGVAAPEIKTPVSEPRRGTGRRVSGLSIFITALISLVAGYFIGTHSQPPAPSSPLTGAIPAPAPEAVVPANPEPDPPAPEPPPAPAPVKASAAAEAALKAFLDAPDWASRAAHVLSPETVRTAMEAYSHKVPDGPTPYQSIKIQNSYTDKSTGNTLFIYQVVTDTHPSGIPVAVAETPAGWQVDWQAFVEFRDDQFKSFADGPAEQTGRFHLIVSTPPAPRAANTGNAHFSSFLLDPPLPGRQRLAYVNKASNLHAGLTAATANGAVFTPVLEVAKRKTPDGRTYLEIVHIIASDWLPEGR